MGKNKRTLDDRYNYLKLPSSMMVTALIIQSTKFLMMLMFSILFGFILGFVVTFVVGGLAVLAIAGIGWLLLKLLEWFFFDYLNI